NAISRKVISNAAHAVAGMALNSVKRAKSDKPGVGLTMFGVTTACVQQIRNRIENDFECFVFHATGTGGQSMEKLVDSGLLESVIDITTTEVADHLFGGVLPCTEDRFGSIIRTKIPYVGSVGAVDMVNFGARETVPKTFEGRKFYIHNPQVTLMRTTPAENETIGRWIVARLNRMTGPVRFMLPLKGVSAIDAEGQPFHDPDADAALFAAIREGWVAARNRKLIEVDAHINDPAFAAEAVKQFKAIV
ncbi:MAG: Tm-1-like ATP-binding domain-containing protein, partial [Aestuariivirga sp.]